MSDLLDDIEVKIQFLYTFFSAGPPWSHCQIFFKLSGSLHLTELCWKCLKHCWSVTADLVFSTVVLVSRLCIIYVNDRFTWHSSVSFWFTHTSLVSHAVILFQGPKTWHTCYYFGLKLHIPHHTCLAPFYLSPEIKPSKTSCVPHLPHSGPIPLSGVSGRLVRIWGLSQVRLRFPKSLSAE